MSSPKILVVSSLMFALLSNPYVASSSPLAKAQVAAPRLVYPVGDFRVGRNLLFDGQFEAASHAFETAFRASRTIGQRHGIDAVPSLCRNSQALYLSGNLPAALATSTDGLRLAFESRFWTAFINRMPIALRPIEIGDGRIAWVQVDRFSQIAVAYPDAWPVAIDTQLALIESAAPNESLQLTITPIWVDALEVFYSQAMGLRIRQKILGELTQHDELTRQLESMYAEGRPNVPEILQRCQNVCLGITNHSLNRNAQARTILESNLQTDNGFDHPLTSVALLELAEIAAEEEDFTRAISRAGQASLLAARLSQIDVLADALHLLVRCSDLNAPGSGSQIAIDIYNWAGNGAGLTYVTALAAAAESASLVNNDRLLGETQRNFDQFTRRTRTYFPHLSAAFALARTRNQIGRGQIEAADVSWQRLKAIALGSESKSPLLSQLAQVSFIENELRLGRTNSERLLQRLAQVAARPNPATWTITPWQAFVWDSLPLNEVYRQLAVDKFRARDPHEIIEFVASWHARKVRCNNPLEERKIALEKQLDRDANDANPPLKDQLLALHARFALLKQNKQTLQEQWEQFKPTLPADMHNWSSDLSRAWDQMLARCTTLDLDLSFAALTPIAIPQEDREFPAIDFALLNQQLGPDSAIVGFFNGTTQLTGYCISSHGSEFWTINEPGRVSVLINSLLQHASVHASAPQLWESLPKPNAWLATSYEICAVLFPESVQEKIGKASHIVVIPDANLWNLPFDMICEQPNGSLNDTWIAKRDIRYAITLEHAGAPEQFGTQGNLLIYNENFFVSEKESDTQFTNDLQSSLPANELQTLPLKAELPASYLTRVFKSNHVLIASDVKLSQDLTLEATGVRNSLARIFPISFGHIARPQAITMFGVSEGLENQLRSDPETIVRLAAHLYGANCKRLILRNWNVAGESTANFAKEFATRFDRNFSVALQRSVLNQWTLQFNSQLEPRFNSTSRRNDGRLLSGELPVFWSGWRLVDSYPLNAWKIDAPPPKP